MSFLQCWSHECLKVASILIFVTVWLYSSSGMLCGGNNMYTGHYMAVLNGLSICAKLTWTPTQQSVTSIVQNWHYPIACIMVSIFVVMVVRKEREKKECQRYLSAMDINTRIVEGQLPMSNVSVCKHGNILGLHYTYSKEKN